jgi:hypothetical protein
LYEAISKIFPTVKAIYIRQTGRNKKESQQGFENLKPWMLLFVILK